MYWKCWISRFRISPGPQRPEGARTTRCCPWWTGTTWGRSFFNERSKWKQFLDGFWFEKHPTWGQRQYYISYYVPRTQLTSIFEGQPSKTGPFPIKTRVIWVLGILYYIHFTEYLVPLSGISLPIVCKYICYLPLLNQKPSLKSQFHSFSSARKKGRFNAKKIGRNVTWVC